MDMLSTPKKYPVRVTAHPDLDRTDVVPWAQAVPLKDLPTEDDLLLGQSRSVTADMLIHAAYNAHAYPMGVSYTGAKKWDWVIPAHRAVILPEKQHFSKTTQQQCRKANWLMTFNHAFTDVLHKCATIPRKPQDVEDNEEEIEWLDGETQKAYADAFMLGLAYSVDVWNEDDKLVGGIFGLYFPNYVTVESMFTIESGASKAALLLLCDWAWHTNKQCVDMQEWSEHLGTLGATRMTAEEFQRLVIKHNRYQSEEEVSNLDYRAGAVVSGIRLAHRY